MVSPPSAWRKAKTKNLSLNGMHGGSSALCQLRDQLTSLHSCLHTLFSSLTVSGCVMKTRDTAHYRALTNATKGPARFTLTKLLLDLTLARILLTLTSLLTPFRGLLAWNLFLGRSCWQVARDVQRVLVRLVGWLSARPRSSALRSLGIGLVDVRRWHIAAGTHCQKEGHHHHLSANPRTEKWQLAPAAPAATSNSYTHSALLLTQALIPLHSRLHHPLAPASLLQPWLWHTPAPLGQCAGCGSSLMRACSRSGACSARWRAADVTRSGATTPRNWMQWMVWTRFRGSWAEGSDECILFLGE
jgi:hypothetical protein